MIQLTIVGGDRGGVHTGTHHKSSSWQLSLVVFPSRRESGITMEFIVFRGWGTLVAQTGTY